MQRSKLYIAKRPVRAVTAKSREDPQETFELELDGIIVNRQTRPPLMAAHIIECFLELHGRRAKAYYIRQSKLNFKPLIDEYGSE